MFYCVGRRAPIVWRQSATAAPVTATMKRRSVWRVEGRRTHSFRTPLVVYGSGGITPPSQTLKTRPKWTVEGRRTHAFREPQFSYGALSGPAPISFAGVVPTQNITQGVFYSLDLAPYFLGSLTPFTYSTFAGTLPTGLTRTGSVISGTPTVIQSAVGIQIRATDTGANFADTNAFNFIVSAAVAPSNGAPNYDKKYTVKIGKKMMVFSSPKAAVQALNEYEESQRKEPEIVVAPKKKPKVIRLNKFMP